MTAHNKVNYLEIPVKEMQQTKDFFTKAFGWGYVDYGPDYAAITDAGIDAGFFISDKTVSTDNGSVLVVLFSDALEQTEKDVTSLGGQIVKPIFSFPGGRRFHFTDPNGNEFAVWSDK